MKDGHLEAKDLMIGDWIYGSHNETNAPRPNWGWHKTRVNDILKVDCMSFGLHSIECCGYECGCVSLKEEEISPILLTTEILEKNGFVNDDGCYLSQDNSYGIDNQQGMMEFFKYKMGEEDYTLEAQIPNCRYVHELQHAFRLCGLTELADNFKI